MKSTMDNLIGINSNFQFRQIQPKRQNIIPNNFQTQMTSDQAITIWKVMMRNPNLIISWKWTMNFQQT